ncbi:hypothetical protein ONZ45_g1468 [Pleurotus djamor]|nr:hypothetical protein ONZ45_g1468 [Pleurotus djamor]
MQNTGPLQDDVLIAVMGATGSGKTTFINLASGDSLRVGAGLRSCTSEVQVSKPVQLDGRRAFLVDTPGFDDTSMSDTDVLGMISAFLAASYSQGKKLSGVIYMHRISDFRMGGLSTRNLRMVKELCGEKTLKNLVLVTNMWGEVSPTVGEQRERELATDALFFKPAIDKGAQLLRNYNERGSVMEIITHIAKNHPLTLRIQRELVDEGMSLSQTAAGTELNRELQALVEKHQVELRELREEMAEALKNKEEELRTELGAEITKLQAETDRIRNDAANMASMYESQKAYMELQMQQMNDTAEANRNALVAEYEGKLQEMENKIQQGTNSAELTKLRAQILTLEKQIAEKPRGGGGGCIIL